MAGTVANGFPHDIQDFSRDFVRQHVHGAAPEVQLHLQTTGLFIGRAQSDELRRQVEFLDGAGFQLSHHPTDFMNQLMNLPKRLVAGLFSLHRLIAPDLL